MTATDADVARLLLEFEKSYPQGLVGKRRCPLDMFVEKEETGPETKNTDRNIVQEMDWRAACTYVMGQRGWTFQEVKEYWDELVVNTSVKRNYNGRKAGQELQLMVPMPLQGLADKSSFERKVLARQSKPQKNLSVEEQDLMGSGKLASTLKSPNHLGLRTEKNKPTIWVGQGPQGGASTLIMLS